MDKKIKLFIVAQLVIVVVFAFLALNCGGSSYTTSSSSSGSYGSGSSSSSSSGWKEVRDYLVAGLKAVAEAKTCMDNNYKYLKVTSTKEDCSSACASSGYTEYCWGLDCNGCYCK